MSRVCMLLTLILNGRIKIVWVITVRRFLFFAPTASLVQAIFLSIISIFVRDATTKFSVSVSRSDALIPRCIGSGFLETPRSIGKSICAGRWGIVATVGAETVRFGFVIAWTGNSILMVGEVDAFILFIECFDHHGWDCQDKRDEKSQAEILVHYGMVV